MEEKGGNLAKKDGGIGCRGRKGRSRQREHHEQRLRNSNVYTHSLLMSRERLSGSELVDALRW